MSTSIAARTRRNALDLVAIRQPDHHQINTLVDLRSLEVGAGTGPRPAQMCCGRCRWRRGV